jgi:hypothetical protein
MPPKDSIIARRTRLVKAPSTLLFQEFSSLGGKKGWLYLNWAWALRGWFDGLIGGVGMRRSQPPSLDLKPGDIIDFWVVEEVISGEMLRLKAEMKLPGDGWLEFIAEPVDLDSSQLSQTAYFVPRGFGGLLYWYLLLPIHGLIFTGLACKLARLAEEVNHRATG